MKKGLVFGKFLPLHKGHIALINFAKKKCEILYVIACCSDKEYPGCETRKYWLEEELGEASNIKFITFCYKESELPNTSVSSKEVSFKWAQAIKEIIPYDIDILFTSEEYGDYVAEAMGISHALFDKSRNIVPISSSQIKMNPMNNLDFLPDPVKPFYIKKIVLAGTESTGKSTLARRLAEHFNTGYVPEVARDIVAHTESCNFDHMYQIAEAHAKAIKAVAAVSKGMIFIDTDIHITRSYSKFLFKKELEVPEWIYTINKADLNLFLLPDCDYVQDGTRLKEEERNILSQYHEAELVNAGISYFRISGNWNERFKKAVELVEKSIPK